jgi:hypothetical protein
MIGSAEGGTPYRWARRIPAAFECSAAMATYTGIAGGAAVTSGESVDSDGDAS